MPFCIYIYKNPLCAKYFIFDCWIFSAVIMSSGDFIYSNLFMVLFNYKLYMLAHINFPFWVERILLNISLDVVIFAADVLTSPGKLFRFPPTVNQVWCVSVLCSRILATISTYVNVLTAGTFTLCIKNIVLIPDGICVPTL